MSEHSIDNTHSLKGIYRILILDSGLRICEILNRPEQASDKRFLCYTPPISGFCGRHAYAKVNKCLEHTNFGRFTPFVKVVIGKYSLSLYAHM